MAWNEPGGSGGNKNNDPWGGGNKNNDGPPDLDEVVKKMQEKFGSIFGGGGGGKSGGGKSGGGMISSGLIGLILIVAAAIWGIAGFQIIDEGKRGVILTLGKYTETTMPGLLWFPQFIQSVEVVDIEQVRDTHIGYRTGVSGRGGNKSVGQESLMLTGDENIVDIQLAVQYKIKSASEYLFNVKDPDLTLRQATESALREVIGKRKMDVVLSDTIELAAQVQELIQIILDQYETGLLIVSVNLQQAQPPEQVQAAFQDAVKAREDNDRLKKEAQAYANDIIPRARGKAARLTQEAMAYKEQKIAEATGEAQRFVQVLEEYKKAPEVTRKRLYIEAVESVMQNSSKVMVDVKGGNNILYLPLDRITQNRLPAISETLDKATESLGSRAPGNIEQQIRETTRSIRGGR